MRALTLASVLVVSLCVAPPAMADLFTVTIVRTDGGGDLAVGQSFTYDIRGTLTNTDPNFGLAFFAYNLEATGPSAITLGDAIVQSGGPEMSTFEQPLGYSVMFNGQVDGDNLIQAGGGQNTIDNVPSAPPNLDFPSEEPVAGVGHGSGVVLHRGTFTIPGGTEVGEYTLQIMADSLFANVLDGELVLDGPDPVVAVATNIGDPLTFTVASTQVPVLIHQAEDGPRSSPCTGYVDPRFDSDNGKVANLCFTVWDEDGGQYVSDEIVMVFDQQVRDAGGEALTTEAFSVEVTGGTAPGVASVDHVMDGGLHIVTIRLDGPIPVQEWTTVIAGVENFSGNPIASNGNQGIGIVEPDRIDIACLPGDVDQSLAVTPFDNIRAQQKFRDTCANEVNCPICSGLLKGYDIDRKGSFTPIDLIRLQQLLLHTGNSTEAWNGKAMNNPQP